MFWTAGPALGDQPGDLPRASASTPTRRRGQHGRGLAVLGARSTSRPLNLLPLVLLVVFTVKKVPPFLAILGSALFAGILACFTQWTQVQGVRRRPGDSGRSRPGSRRSTRRWRPASSARAAFQAIDQLFSRGGMASLLTTVWLVLAALSFAAILEHAGFLERLLRPVVTQARGRADS